ncbi:hypothetical protein Tco_0340661 [Tanacetum coccineum]
MGKDLLSDHKIISEEELKCEAKNCLKEKQRKSSLSYHGFVGETQFQEPPKVPLKRRHVNLKKNLKQAQLIQEKVFAIAALKNELRKSSGNSVDTKFAKPSAIYGKIAYNRLRTNQLLDNQMRLNLNAFKSERPKFSKSRFASQVDVKNDFSKPVTPHYWPKVREPAKPHHVIASSESRNSSKNMPRFSSNDMVHNHYLEKAKKKTHERDKNSKTSVMLSARLQTLLMVAN